jgi:hypothetical protein
VTPLACFPREPLVHTTSPSWLLASLLPDLYERSFRWWPVLQQMAFYLSHVVSHMLMWVLHWLQVHSAWCYCRSRENVHTDFQDLVKELAAPVRAISQHPLHLVPLAAPSSRELLRHRFAIPRCRTARMHG